MAYITNRTRRCAWAAAVPLALAIALAGCSGQATTTTASQSAEVQESNFVSDEIIIQEEQAEAPDVVETVEEAEESEPVEEEESPAFSLTREDLTIDETITDSANESHAIVADGTDAQYSNVEVVKTGEADGDEADFYGTNAAVFATNGATLNLSDVIVTTAGTHANAVFSYGEGTTINISHSIIETTENCSGGIMVTGGGTLNATDLLIHTYGNSSAAIRSDRGGGTQIVSGGSYTTEGKGSPVIYSTANVTVSDATLTSTSSQGVVVEGKNSVTLKNVNLTADNNSKNSDKSDWYQAVMIYQSMSGDADEGLASFAMEDGSLTNMNGDIFFVTNTQATIDLTNVAVVNEDAEGVFLRAAQAGWGTSGSNGGHVTLTAAKQAIDGNMLVDEASTLNLYLTDSSAFTGAINPDGSEGEVYVEIEDGSTWTLTGDSYITSLTCSAGAIDLNGYTLYVNGVAYTEGTASTGSAIEVAATGASGMGGGPGEMGGAPNGMGGPGGMGGEPPAKPGA